MNEQYLFDFCPPGFTFPKKVQRVLYSTDGKRWYARCFLGADVKMEGWVTGYWQRFLFYDGTLSAIYPVPPEQQIWVCELRASIWVGGGWF